MFSPIWIYKAFSRSHFDNFDITKRCVHLGCNYIRSEIQIIILEGNFSIDHNDDTNPDATEEYFREAKYRIIDRICFPIIAL